SLSPSESDARTLQIRFHHQFDGQPLELSSRVSTQGTGPFSITRCDYLVSGFRLQEKDGPWRPLKHFGTDVAYISAADGKGEITFENLPTGTFSALGFDLGVSGAINASDPNSYPPDHPLNPAINGLHWGWQGGYIHLALEGHFEAPNDGPSGFSYHIAKDGNRIPIILETALTTERDCTVEIGFDLARTFNAHSFTRDGTSTHSRKGDPLVSLFRKRIESAFHISGMIRETWQPIVRTGTATTSVGRPFDFRIPNRFPKAALPPDNFPTVEGVTLGRRLFLEKRLSKNEAQSCADCHEPKRAFTENRPISLGSAGQNGSRNAMPLTNLLWEKEFFWDGRAPSLREQVLRPIEDAHEMNLPLSEATERLSSDPTYRKAFASSFGSPVITSERMALALEQYLLTEISTDSRFDQAMRRETQFTAEEKRGFELFITEFDPARNLKGADCFHCHGGTLFTNHRYANNGLDETFADLGRFAVTKNQGDYGLFKTPSLRNVAVTGPYMHDGHFATLEEVIDHYDHGIQRTLTLDPNIAKHPESGLGLSDSDKKALIAFLQTLTDPRFSQPQSGKNDEPEISRTSAP
ncbi:MAG: MbnP family protein, partial [Verrucomicrobiota bacterium]